MDDIQFWIYLIFGAIYLIGRALRKPAKKQQRPGRPRSPLETGEERSERGPLTFEELLEQVTGQRELRRVDEQLEEVTALEPVEEPEPEREQKPHKKSSGVSGSRAFADEESRRVYEESIRMAEGSDISFERDDNFKNRLRSRNEVEEDVNAYAAEIKEMLQHTDSARKAVILGEILNRKY